MMRPIPEPPTAPLTIRLVLIALLPLILVYLYLEGQDFDPGMLEIRPEDNSLNKWLPRRLGSLVLAGPIRRYDQDSLYEYIDGHAEYFLAAGFRDLAVADYGRDAENQPQVVVNLYQLDSPLNAFAVLANEAGSGANVEVGTLGIANEQGINFIQGPWYVQMSLFDPALPNLELAQQLASQLPVADGAALSLCFPPLGEVVETQFVRKSYHGLDFLDKVLERTFRRAGQELRAFLISAPEAEIQRLTGELGRYLAAEGIPARSESRQGLTFHSVQDPYEGDWFYVALPDCLVGVYRALDASLMEEIGHFAQQSPTHPSAPRAPVRP